MDNVTNLFVHRSAAQRYASARPYFHPLIAQRINSFTSTFHFTHALDVACGTGQSSRALAEIVDFVDAVDISPEMVGVAEPHDRIRYHISSAEAMPFCNELFDLATVGLAFHWFDQAKFLSEANRVLKANAWLVIYTSGFSGEMVEVSAFRDWGQNVYPRRFPAPPRRSYHVTLDSVEPFGFTLRGEEKFTHNERMNADQLTAYLLTQTNVIAAVEGSVIPLDVAANWIQAGIKPYFNGKIRTMKFVGSIAFLRQTAAVQC